MEITIYTTPHCGVCKMIKKSLTDKGKAFTEINDEERVMEASEESGFTTAPIIKIDGGYILVKDFAKKVGL